MSWLPNDWEAYRASGWWGLHHLRHKPCGWQSRMPYDLVIDTPGYGRPAARQVVFGHRCEGEN